MQQSTLVTVRIKPEIAARLEKLAELMDRSKSYLAAEAIEEYLEINEWQVQAIKEGIAAADRGETVNFEDIKKHWEKRIENPSN
jgi:RHH-type rel operon transcriptional repressor/antitoxin RelB